MRVRPVLRPEEAKQRWVAGLARVAPHAEDRGVTILVEALPSSQCDVVTTIEEAVGVVRQIGSPAIQTMFDSHNAEDETRTTQYSLTDTSITYVTST